MFQKIIWHVYKFQSKIYKQGIECNIQPFKEEEEEEEEK